MKLEAKQVTEASSDTLLEICDVLSALSKMTISYVITCISVYIPTYLYISVYT
jgi:hypothetical protein